MTIPKKVICRMLQPHFQSSICTILESNHQQGCQNLAQKKIGHCSVALAPNFLRFFWGFDTEKPTPNSSRWAAPLIEIRRFHQRPRTLLRPRDQRNLSRDHLGPGQILGGQFGDLGEISWDILGILWDVIIKNWDMWGFNEDITRNLSLKWQKNQLS